MAEFGITSVFGIVFMLSEPAPRRLGESCHVLMTDDTRDTAARPAFGVDPHPGRIEHQVSPPAVYYVDVDGVRWRILDCIMASGHLRRTSLEATRASCRVFLHRDGTKRLHGRRPHEIWKLTPAVCRRQLRRSSPANENFADDEVVTW